MILALAGSAFAQVNPELGEVGGSASGSVKTTTTTTSKTWQPPTADQRAAATDVPPAPAADTTTTSETTTTTTGPTGTDHEANVGSFGVGFFGVQNIPLCLSAGCGAGGGGAINDATEVVAAPSIGMRYWLDSKLGLEGAIGFAHHSGGGEIVTPAGMGNTTASYDDPTYTAFLLHGAVPIALADSQHFTFEVIPELNFGIAGGSQRGPTSAQDVSLSGLMFELGGRVGAEVHFGFMGLPKLALVGSVGLHLRAEHRRWETGNGSTAQSHNTFNIGTSVNGNPWDIFTGNITAIYYF